MLPCRQWQTTRYDGIGRQEEAVRINLACEGKQGKRKRQVKAARRGRKGQASKYAEALKQRSKEAGKGRVGRWQVSRVEKKRDSHAAWQTGSRQVGRQVPGREHKILAEQC
jgi:hypothetical protein